MGGFDLRNLIKFQKEFILLKELEKQVKIYVQENGFRADVEEALQNLEEYRDGN